MLSANSACSLIFMIRDSPREEMALPGNGYLWQTAEMQIIVVQIYRLKHGSIRIWMQKISQPSIRLLLYLIWSIAERSRTSCWLRFRHERSTTQHSRFGWAKEVLLHNLDPCLHAVSYWSQFICVSQCLLFLKYRHFGNKAKMNPQRHRHSAKGRVHHSAD